MNRRRWLILIVAAFASVAFLDVTLWVFATRALRQEVQNWTERLRANGVDVALGPTVFGGWPTAATVRFGVRFGPVGLPGQLALDATLTTSLSPARPSIVRTDVERLVASDPAGRTLTATATDWVVDTPIATPDQPTTTAHKLLLSWANHGVTIGSLVGASSPGSDGGVRVTLQASDIDLAASGAALPASSGSLVRSLRIDSVVFGGLPRAAATAEESARAWQSAGGRIDVAHLAAAYGPLDIALAGHLALDEALQPTGSGTLEADGLPPLLQDLGSAGIVPPHAAQAAAGVLALLGAGRGGHVQIPLEITDGRLALAGIPVLKLPAPPWLRTQRP